MSGTPHYTVDELMCVCISRQIEDGEMVVQGMATPLVAAGYLLAKLTHAPHVVFASVTGNSLCLQGGPLALSRVEDVWVGRAQRFVTFTDVVFSVLPGFQPKEFFRPAQVDACGSTNNVVFGSYLRPKLRLPGSAGIADLTGTSPHVYLYVPRHGKASFVSRLDFRSGVGVLSGEEKRAAGVTGPGPRCLISDLGCFDFGNGRMRLTSYHPGVTIERIQQKTGFALEIAEAVTETVPPSDDEVRLLREVIDPLGIRTLEVLGGAERWQRLRAISEAEARLED